MGWPVLRRAAARVILLDPDSRVLLLHGSDPADPGAGDWWEIPGGGIDRGETSVEAAERELREETGVVGIRMGPCVHRCRNEFTFGGLRFDSDDHVHVAWIDDPGAAREPVALETLEAAAFDGERWWRVDEVVAAAGSGTRFLPPGLPDVLLAVVATPEPPGPLVAAD